MPGFAGIDHRGLTVTDLDVGERFSIDVGFGVVMDCGHVRSPLQFTAFHAVMAQRLQELRERDVPREEIRARAEWILAAHETSGAGVGA